MASREYRESYQELDVSLADDGYLRCSGQLQHWRAVPQRFAAQNDLIVTPDGKWTERGWAVKFPTTFPADMAFDGQWLWQVGVGSGNPIYKMDPATGEVQGSISNRVWSAKAQRSLAYNPPMMTRST